MNSQLVRKMSSRPGRTDKTRRSEGGYVLVAATAVVAVLLGTGLAFMRWSTDEAMQSQHTEAAIKAYYLAQMGVVEKGFHWLRNLQESDMPTSERALEGREVREFSELFGRYSDVRVTRIVNESEGDFWTQSRMYRISAVGEVDVPWRLRSRDGVNTIKRRAVLYVRIRSFSDYMYLSNYEQTIFGDYIKFSGITHDTLNGRVHSNSQIAIQTNPVFYDQVTQSGSWNDFMCVGGSCNPIFLGPPPRFRVAPVDIPDMADNLRAGAHSRGRFENPGLNKQQRMRINGSNIDLWTWNLGQSFDSTAEGTVHTVFNIPGGQDFCFFTETPLELMGFDVSGRITIGSGQLIRLLDDVRVAGVGPPRWEVSPGNTNYIGIVSERQVKIANTWANGREHSSGLGAAQPNQNLTSIVITAAVVALGKPSTGETGSFTFENQNDTDSGYVCTPCGCLPNPGNNPDGSPRCAVGPGDERGKIWLYGSLTQKRRGYVHRSCCTGTGYDKQYRYDKRFLKQRPPCFFSAVDSTGRALFDVVQWGRGETMEALRVQGADARVRFN